MGRHRRSAAGRAATGRAAGTPEHSSAGGYTEQYGDAYGADHAGAYREQTSSYPSHSAHGAYASAGAASPASSVPSYSPQDETLTAVYGSISSAGGSGVSGDPQRGRAHRRKKRDGVPLRTGLLGASAAVAMGAVAVASGLIPGGDNFKLGGDHNGNKVQAADSPTVEAQGGTDGTVEDRASESAASRGQDRSASPSASPSKSASAEPSAKPSKTPERTEQSQKDSGSETKTKTASPSKSAAAKTEAPAAGSGSATTTSDEAAAAAQVLTLVNQERAKVGCSPVTADSGLASLASDFSEDMAARNFFDHTDPDGATPWDRAKKAGITNLGGENIARGQANAQSVMDAWMNSEGHKANILNCDFKTLGVGVHFGSGGPWWTQDFGY
ncbi:CAP domain-containing protein [Streptomyces sp. SID8379]|nr:CAP domain-containing protein [Streptomyces sp. SID8379]MYW65309.1 CAP domain-containing protein [Streptomyces sp. SID8379]